MDIGHLFNFSFNMEFAVALLSIMLVNIVLSGDNAVVIAMAVRSLPDKQRKQGILYGTGIAVLLRIVLTFFAAKLLDIPFMKLAGGILVAWIAVKLFLEEGAEGNAENNVKNVWKAITTILIADLVMSVDNVLAVAGASRGNLTLLVIGLGMSIPIVILASSFLSRLMERFPVIIWIGAAILGKVAGSMIMEDPMVEKIFHNPGQLVEYSVQAFFALGVVVSGRFWMKWRSSHMKPVQIPSDQFNPFYVNDWDMK
ncbi:MAG: TerC family protein [Proteobacteria bacterium]|nr:TerC family protein [Pseudomonadota bacterium]